MINTIIVTVMAPFVIAAPAHDGAPIDQCNDGVGVHYTASGQLMGDQDHNGVLDGEDCNWT